MLFDGRAFQMSKRSVWVEAFPPPYAFTKGRAELAHMADINPTRHILPCLTVLTTVCYADGVVRRVLVTAARRPFQARAFSKN